MATYFVSGKVVTRFVFMLRYQEDCRHFERIIKAPLIKNQSTYEKHIRKQLIKTLNIPEGSILRIETCTVLFTT